MPEAQVNAGERYRTIGPTDGTNVSLTFMSLWFVHGGRNNNAGSCVAVTIYNKVDGP